MLIDAIAVVDREAGDRLAEGLEFEAVCPDCSLYRKGRIILTVGPEMRHGRKSFPAAV
jgi:hypothetical protein